MYTVWWDHAHKVASDVTHANVDADDLGNVFIGSVPSPELAQAIGDAFKQELAVLGFDVLVAVSN